MAKCGCGGLCERLLLWLSEEDEEKGKQGHATKRSKSWFLDLSDRKEPIPVQRFLVILYARKVSCCCESESATGVVRLFSAFHISCRPVLVNYFDLFCQLGSVSCYVLFIG